MKKIRVLALLAAAMLLASGCNIIVVNPERDGAQVVATVETQNITKKQVYDYSGYTIGQKVNSWDQDTFKTNKQYALEDMINRSLMVYEAKLQKSLPALPSDAPTGIEGIKNADSYFYAVYQAYYATALAKYKKLATTDTSVDPEKKAQADMDTFLASIGTSKDDFPLIQKLYKSITDPVTVKDSDVQTEYNNELSSQQTSYDKDPKQAVTDENSGTTLIYYAANYVRVKQILVPIPKNIEEQITADRQNNSTDSNNAADKLRDDALKTLESTANEALSKAQACGGDLAKLDQLIKDYKALGDTDPGMDTLTDGYLVIKDTTAYVSDFTNAALALTDLGKPTLIKTDYGYHIIWMSKQITKSTLPFADVKDKLTKQVLATQQATTWSNQMQTWYSSETKSITTYYDRLNN